jgi:glucose dehydrogenase
VRPGDNLWTDAVFARDPETGKAHWAYQYSPHDLWDHSGVNENIVLDLPWQGKVRKVIIRPERNGYMYVLDRTTGEVLAADQYVPTPSRTASTSRPGGCATSRR